MKLPLHILQEIKFISHSEIDKVKWDAAVDRHVLKLPYAYSWYLDITANGKWDGVICGDYEVVMPLCWNEKIPGYKQVYQPVLTQQLGFFGDQVHFKVLNLMMIKACDQFKKIQISFNPGLPPLLSAESSQHRTNLILPLNKLYVDIQPGYSKSLKKRLRKSQDLWVEEVSEIAPVVAFFQANIGVKDNVPDVNYKIPFLLFSALQKRGKLKIYEVQSAKYEILARGIFIDHVDRIINIFGASNDEGRLQFAMHAMLNHVIQVHAESHQIFDFEGSDLPGVQEFFLSFGAINQPYSTYTRDEMPWLVKKLMKVAKRLRF